MTSLHNPDEWLRPRGTRRRGVARRDAGRTVLLDELVLLKHIASGATVETAAAQASLTARSATRILATMCDRFKVSSNDELLQQPEVTRMLQGEDQQQP